MTGVLAGSCVRVGVALLAVASFWACKKPPESDARAPAEIAAPVPNPVEPKSEIEQAKQARADALASKEAIRHAVEFAQSSSAAAKNAAAAAQRAADAADAAVEAMRKIPQAPPATPSPSPRAGK